MYWLIGSALVLCVAGVAALRYHTGTAQMAADLVAPWRHGYSIQRDVMVPMPDGVKLSMNIHTPAFESGPFPTIYIQTPYGAAWSSDGRSLLKHFTERGYVVVVQHVRGRYQSEGTFTPGKTIGSDSSTTLSWLSEQPWSNGRVGTFGCSYLGETQITLARERHPAHKAIIAQGAGGAIGSARDSYGYFGTYEGGVLNLASAFGWFKDEGDKHRNAPRPPDPDPPDAVEHLPVIDALRRIKSEPTDFEAFASRPLGDPWWHEMGYIADTDRFATPALHVNGWFDQTVAGTMRLADVMRANATTPEGRRQHVIIGPGLHCQDERAPRRVGELPVENTAFPHFQVYDRWFDYWLKDEGDALDDLPPYQVFVLGRNTWRAFDTWPPDAAEPRRFYLHADRSLLPDQPAADAEPATYTYDPLDPVPTLGGAVCCTGDPPLRAGSFDQRALPTRHDVLTYVSPPLEEELILTGEAEVVLHVSSSAPDTDFTAKLIDVWPDGRAFNVRDSVIRARYRNGFGEPELMTPGEKHMVTVRLPPVAYAFKEGHRLRLDISSSNFPRLERNLNTGGDNVRESSPETADNTVFQDAGSASHVMLPILSP